MHSFTDYVYECALYGICTDECAAGEVSGCSMDKNCKEPGLRVRTQRYIQRLIEKLEQTGNIYGCTDYSEAVVSYISRHSEMTDTLLLLGKNALCKSPRSVVQAIALLEAANIEFTVLGNEPDTGFARLFLVGATEETRQMMADAAAIFDQYKTVVTYDPQDTGMLLYEYGQLGISLTAQAESYASFVLTLIRSEALRPRKGQMKYALQDTCFLEGPSTETVPALEILKVCGDVSEIPMDSPYRIPAGNLIVNECMPEAMEQMMKDKWRAVAGLEIQVLVVESTADYLLLKAARPDNVELMTIEEVVLKCL